ncbi:MAG: hypothetical protein M3T56_00965 [Chloroflexota bacterium]|nr:hypothetical protein [Chloroflexota bacterium]
MDTTRRPVDDLLDLARALLLLQGALLVATTIEALFWSLVFPGSGGSLLMSAASAVVILVARTRLRADRRWARRFVYTVEGLILVGAAVDIVLAIAITHRLPPVVALLTQLVLPLSVVAILRRSARATRAAIQSSPVAVGGAS